MKRTACIFIKVITKSNSRHTARSSKVPLTCHCRSARCALSSYTSQPTHRPVLCAHPCTSVTTRAPHRTGFSRPFALLLGLRSSIIPACVDAHFGTLIHSRRSRPANDKREPDPIRCYQRDHGSTAVWQRTATGSSATSLQSRKWWTLRYVDNLIVLASLSHLGRELVRHLQSLRLTMGVV